MKMNQSIFGLSMLLLLGACGQRDAKSFLPGIYVNSAAGELSRADDTLEVLPPSGTNFTINRRTGFNLIRNGLLGKREHAKEVWTTIYDDATQMLTETTKGKVITIYPDSGFIRIGKRKYIKH